MLKTAVQKGTNMCMNIQPDEHALIEEAVRGMAANSENGESFVNRLDRYVTLHPYH